MTHLISLMFISFMVIISQNALAEKQNLVLLPIQISEHELHLKNAYENALAEALSQKYAVYYGAAVEKQLEKEYEKTNCSAEQCSQNIAIAFNGELIADASIIPISSSYIIKLKITNVLTDRIIEQDSRTIPCRDCDPLTIITLLQTILDSKGKLSGITSSTSNSKTKLLAQLGITLKTIPEGHFMMGSNTAHYDAKPVHQVTISSFEIMEHEVTWSQYQHCIDAGACTEPDSDEGWGKEDRPVIHVSWNDTQKYITWINDRTNMNFRLPTEAEWEYAARAGTTTKYNWGNNVGLNRANCDGCGSPWDNSSTAPVGSFQKNAWGLFDIHGNVWEWTQDCWNDSYDGAPSNGEAWLEGDCDNRILRGGSWYNKPARKESHRRIGAYIPNRLRSSSRLKKPANYNNNRIGFRLVRDTK